MNFKKYFFFSLLTFLSLGVYAQGNSSVVFIVDGATYSNNAMDHGQINNPAIPIPAASTIGLFSTPPTSGTPEFAMVLATLTGAPLDTGIYELVEVINEYPNIQALTSPRGGFITLVEKTPFGSPNFEYYSKSGTVTVSEVSASVIRGTFDAQLEGNNQTIQVTGSFTINL